MKSFRLQLLQIFDKVPVQIEFNFHDQASPWLTSLYRFAFVNGIIDDKSPSNMVFIHALKAKQQDQMLLMRAGAYFFCFLL